jgi:hypothetical protein
VAVWSFPKLSSYLLQLQTTASDFHVPIIYILELVARTAANPERLFSVLPKGRGWQCHIPFSELCEGFFTEVDDKHVAVGYEYAAAF